MFFVTFITKSLTEYDRKRLCLTLLCLNVFQIFLAISGFFLGAYISLSVNSKAHLIKGYSLKPIGGTASGCCIALFLLHCLGAKASDDCGYRRTRQRFENRLLIFVLGYVIMSATFLAILVFCAVQYSKLKPTLSYGLLHSMRFYSQDKNKKREFDEIQMEYRCCGSSNYTDWFKVKWMPEIALPSETDKVHSRRDYLHSVPFSCCDPSNTSPCFHRRLLSAEREGYKHPNRSFFKEGCTEVLLEVLTEVIQRAALLVLVPFLLEVTIAIQTRYLQTSFDDSRRRRNPGGIGSCWLFKRHKYEADLQFEEATVDESLSSSSSEESVIYKPERKMHPKNMHDEAKNSQIQPKRKDPAKSQMSASDGYDDIKTLLSKQMGKNSKDSRFKSGSPPEEKAKEKATAKSVLKNKQKQIMNKNGSGGT